MEPIRNKNLTGNILKGALALSASITALAGVGAAQVSTRANAPLTMQTDYLGYALGVSARASYSDNINLQSGSTKRDEFALSTALSGGAIVSVPRVTAIMLGDLDFSYLTDQNDFVVNQRIGATSTFTGVDDWLYFDLSGSTSRQLVGDNARFSSNINAGRGQRANVHSYVASPYLYRQLANQSTVEMRYRFSQTFVDDANNVSVPAFSFSRNDTTTHEALASYESGSTFDKVRVRVTAYGADTTEETAAPFPDFGYRQGSVTGDVQYALSNQFALSGSIGYDDIETQGLSTLFFNDSDLSGLTWRAGFTAQPGPKSRVRFEYGERFGDDFIDANISYNVTNRLRVDARASRSFRTRTQSVASGFATNQLRTLQFADQLRQGGEQSPRSIINTSNFIARGLNGFSAQTNGVAVSDSLRVSATGDFGRTILSFNGNYNDDDFGFRQVETVGAGLRVRRDISRQTTGYFNVNYRRADTTVDVATCQANPTVFGLDPTDPLFDAVADCAALVANNGVSSTLLGRLGASRTIYKNASAFVEVSHSERFSQNAALEYSENTVMIGLTLDFN